MSVTFGNPCSTPWYCRGEYKCRYGNGCGGLTCDNETDLDNCIANDVASWGCDNDCAGEPDDYTALQCFLTNVYCVTKGCDRSLTDCYFDAIRSYMQKWYDNFTVCQSCKDAANSAATACFDNCSSTYDTCYAACSGNIACETACADSLATCNNGCDSALNNSLAYCGIYTEDSDYFDATTDCQISESHRTESDNGIDSRPKPTCQSGELKCLKGPHRTLQIAYTSNFTANQSCIARCGGDSDCIAGCNHVQTVADAAALGSYRRSAMECCIIWRKSKLDGDGVYDRSYFKCGNDYNYCVASCGSDSDCLAGCEGARISCFATLGNAATCVNCAQRALNNQGPDTFYTPYDFGLFYSRFTC